MTNKNKVTNKSADIVIIGAGGAGLTAADQALDLGASVIVLDKMKKYGGNTILAGSCMNTPNPETQRKELMKNTEKEKVEYFLSLEPKNSYMKNWQEELKREWKEYQENAYNFLFDSPSLYKLQTYVGGDYQAKAELVDILGDRSLGIFHWMEDKGTEWQDSVNAAIGATWRRSHTPTREKGLRGVQFVKPQYDYALKNGAEIIFQAKAERLAMENDRILGVSGILEGERPFYIKANKAVIIATGGFAANVEMRQKYNRSWSNLDETIKTTNGKHATGDGIKLGEDVGASLIDMEYIQLLPAFNTITTYIENEIYVNKKGLRFFREDGRRDELSNAALKQEDSCFYVINDSHIVDEEGYTIVGKNVNPRLKAGTLLKADSLEDLADKISCPRDNLLSSVEDFNRAVEKGQDKFGRAVFDQKLDKAPYYACKTGPRVHYTMGGLEIDEKARVLDKSGQPIKGLFAAGEVTGGIHGKNRLGGNAITEITIFGKIAGKNAVEMEF